MLRPILLNPNPTQGQVGRFLIICMALGFTALLAAGIAAVWANQKIQEHSGWVDHSYQVELAIADTRIRIEQAETTRRGYLLTGDPAFVRTYRETTADLGKSIDRIAALTRDNSRQANRIAALRRLSDDIGHGRDVTIQLIGQGHRAEADALFQQETSAKLMRGIRDAFQAMLDDEQALLSQRDAMLRGSITTFYWILGIAGILLLLVAIVSLNTLLRYTRDLAASREQLSTLNDSLEDLVTERTADLSRANDEIQRFAYIVSHDLRSPLVNVMGFTAELDASTVAVAELIERADAAAPDIVTEEARTAALEDLPEAIGFIRTSTQKMDRLINAILKLSREGRRVLTPEPIDLGEMFATIRGSVQHRIDEGNVDFVIEQPLPALASDRVAMEQILSNLVENALKYSAPDRTPRIVGRGRREGPRVVIEVQDNGRGIAANDHARIFDLFRRSGSQDQPGEGIGLAHVRALAYRLGGVIDVESELGSGSIFRLTLPPTLSDSQEA